MIKLPKIPCFIENHRKMNYDFACMNKLCKENNDQLACLYCCEEYHQSHMGDVVAIKYLLNDMAGYQEKKGYNILKLLLRGIETCQTKQELKDNFEEVLAYRDNPQKFEELIDEEAEILQKNTAKFYQRVRERETKQELQQKQSFMVKDYISPILNFKEGGNYALNSPFSVSALKDELITVFAYPNLSKFHDSVDITLKIDRYTPSWLAVGLSIGQAKYQEKSPKHILAISNGWISNKGVLQKSKIKFSAGDTIRLKWDKSMQLLQFITLTSRSALKLQNRWNEQIHLCICLFYKGDTVHILS